MDTPRVHSHNRTSPTLNRKTLIYSPQFRRFNEIQTKSLFDAVDADRIGMNK